VPLLPLLTAAAAAAFALAVAHETAAVLQPWDQELYTRQLSTSKTHVKASTAAAPYLQLGSILQGLSQLLQQLLGLQLQLQPLQPGEGWAPGVLKVAVSCQDLGQLGVLYLDLLTRPGKPGASGILYPLRCGRQLPGMWGQLPTTRGQFPACWQEFGLSPM
jgi:intermediate peptidase